MNHPITKKLKPMTLDELGEAYNRQVDADKAVAVLSRDEEETYPLTQTVLANPAVAPFLAKFERLTPVIAETVSAVSESGETVVWVLEGESWIQAAVE